MSGLYNIVMGDGNERHRGELLGVVIQAQPADFERFRDAWVERDESSGLRIAVYTRLGGGNRPDYQHVFDAMKANPLYLFDRDDSYDSTYATFYFKVPAIFPEPLRSILEQSARPPVDMSEKWQEALDRLHNEGPTEKEKEAFRPLGEALNAALSGQPMPDQSGSPVQIISGQQLVARDES